VREGTFGGYQVRASHGVVPEGVSRRGTKTKEKANERVQILHMRAANPLNEQRYRSNPSSAQCRTYVLD
jgi:hypothetical protein